MACAAREVVVLGRARGAVVEHLLPVRRVHLHVFPERVARGLLAAGEVVLEHPEAAVAKRLALVLHDVPEHLLQLWLHGMYWAVKIRFP